jgi:NADPH:quinone reductase-like Zn-dependent oxidoreductase
MHAVTITQEGAPVASNIKFVSDWPDVTAGPGEVRVRTEASALNHLDLFVGMGMPGLGLTYPRVSGSDGCGRVDQVGAGVDESWIGKRVLLNACIPVPDPAIPGGAPAADDRIMIGEHVHGALAASFTAPATNVLDVGEADASEAVACGLTFLTAWRMLTTRAQVKPGQSVLIPGIGGGVALAALAIAKHLGCTAIVTSRHDAKLERAAQLGADHGILDRGEDFSREVRQATGKRGVDVCVDSVGKAIHTACIKSLARGGTFVTCGATTGHAGVTDLTRIFWNQLAVLGSTMGDMHEFRQVIALFLAGKVKPVIDSTFAPSDGALAFARLERAEQFGKIVIKWS